MSNEPRDRDNADIGDPGSEPEEQTSADDGVEESPLVDEATAQSSDDAEPAIESLTDSGMESPVEEPPEAESAETEPEAEAESPETEPEAESPESEPEAESPETEPEAEAESPETEPEAEAESPETEPEAGSTATEQPDGLDGSSSSGGTTVGPAEDAGGGASAGTGFAPPPPQPGPIYQAPPPVRRLTRDPYSKLGGVASGIAHYYGIDVSLVRLAIVALSVTTGVGFLLYFVAWLVIPRAEVWPPPPPPGGYRGGRMDNRQLALGLIAIGLLIIVFAGGGAGTRVLIALGLIAGGIWVFNQRPAPTAPPVAGSGPEPVPPAQSGAAVGAPATPSSTATADANAQRPIQTAEAATQGPSDSPTPWASDSSGGQAGFEWSSSGGTGGSGGYEPPNQTFYQATAYPPPQPVPPRRRRIWPWVLIGVLLLAPIMAVGALFAVFAALEGGDVSFSTDGGGEYFVEADVPEEIPLRIREGAGQLNIDLTDLDAADFDGEDVPVPVEVDMTAGQIVVDLPEDLPVTIDADIGAAGEIEVFDNSREGFRPQYSLSEPDPLVELDIHLGVGEILVQR